MDDLWSNLPAVTATRVKTTCSQCSLPVTIDTEALSLSATIPSNGQRGDGHVPAHDVTEQVSTDGDLVYWDCPQCGYADSTYLDDDVRQTLSALGAASKRPAMADAPTKQPMKAGIKPAQRKNPTQDQKKFRRGMNKKAYTDDEVREMHRDPESVMSCPNCGRRGPVDEMFIQIDGITFQCDTCGAIFDPDAGDEMDFLSSKNPKNSSSTNGSTPTKESTMTAQPTEADLLQRLASATTLLEQSALAAQLDEFRAQRREAALAEASLDWSAMDQVPQVEHGQQVTSTLEQAAGSFLDGGDTYTEHLATQRLSADSDWLMMETVAPVDDQTLTTAMRAQATQWYEDGVWAPVKESHQEFSVQAHNAAQRAGSAYGTQRTAAASVFLAQVDHLYRKEKGLSVTASICPKCKGTGAVFPYGAPCRNCQGTGRVASVTGATDNTTWGTDPMRPGPDPTIDTYVSDGKDSLPVGVDPADADKFDENTLPGSDGNAGTDPKSSTDAGVQQSLKEGEQPEGDKAEGTENPLTGDKADASAGAFGNDQSDRMNTQSALDPAAQFGSQVTGGLQPRTSQVEAGFFNHPKVDGPMGGQSEWDNLARIQRERREQSQQDAASKPADTGTGITQSEIDSYNSNRTSGLSSMFASLRVEADGEHKDPRQVRNPWDGKPITCTNCGNDTFRTTGRSLDLYNHECANCGHINHTMTETGMSASLHTADAQSSEWGLGLGIDEGESPEGDHAESPVQNPGEGAADKSGDGQGWPTNPGTGGTGDATSGAAPGTPYHSSIQTDAQTQAGFFSHPAETFNVGDTVRNRGADHEYGTVKNVGDDGRLTVTRHHDYGDDDEVGDAKTYRHFKNDPTRAAASLSPNAQVFVQTLSRMSSLDESVGGITGHQIVALLDRDPTVPAEIREALRAGGNPFARSTTAASEPDLKCSNCGATFTAGQADGDGGRIFTGDACPECSDGRLNQKTGATYESELWAQTNGNCSVYPEGETDEDGADEPYCEQHRSINGRVVHEMNNGLYRVTEGGEYIDGTPDKAEALSLAREGSRTAAKDTGTCAACGRWISYDKSNHKWTHDDGEDYGHEVKPARAASLHTANGEAAAEDPERMAAQTPEWIARQTPQYQQGRADGLAGKAPVTGSKTAAGDLSDEELRDLVERGNRLSDEWDKAFADLKAAGVEHDADHPAAKAYRDASDASNHVNRKLDYYISTGRVTSKPGEPYRVASKTSAKAPERRKATMPNGTEVWEVLDDEGNVTFRYPVDPTGDTTPSPDSGHFRPVGSKTADLADSERAQDDGSGHCKNCGLPVKPKGDGPRVGHAREGSDFPDLPDSCKGAKAFLDSEGYHTSALSPITANLSRVAVAWGLRHYEDLAEAIGTLPDGERQKAAKHFAEHLKGTSPNYRPEQFEQAASTSGYRVRGGTGSANYTRGHFQSLADAVKSYDGDKAGLSAALTSTFRRSNPRFDSSRFEKATASRKTAADYIECPSCAAYGTFYCRESVGNCDLCGQYGDVFMDYSGSGDRETPNETVCLSCLCNGKHLKAAHTPEGQAMVKSLGLPATASLHTAGMKDCPTCGGPKADSNGVVRADPDCPTCHGTGYVQTPDGSYSRNPQGNPDLGWVPKKSSNRFKSVMEAVAMMISREADRTDYRTPALPDTRTDYDRGKEVGFADAHTDELDLSSKEKIEEWNNKSDSWKKGWSDGYESGSNQKQRVPEQRKPTAAAYVEQTSGRNLLATIAVNLNKVQAVDDPLHPRAYFHGCPAIVEPTDDPMVVKVTLPEGCLDLGYAPGSQFLNSADDPGLSLDHGPITGGRRQAVYEKSDPSLYESQAAKDAAISGYGGPERLIPSEDRSI